MTDQTTMLAEIDAVDGTEVVAEAQPGYFRQHPVGVIALTMVVIAGLLAGAVLLLGAPPADAAGLCVV